MPDVIDAQNAITRVRDLTGALLVETDYRRTIRLADLRDGIAHAWNEHFYNFAMTPQSVGYGYAPCFCVLPGMIERTTGRKEEGHGQSSVYELLEDPAMQNDRNLGRD